MNKMREAFKKILNTARLVSTVLTCAMLALHLTYLCLNLKGGVGKPAVNIVFIAITAVSIVIRILAHSRLIKGKTTRRIKRGCRVAKILTNILALITTVYGASVGESILSLLMLPVWFFQLGVEIITGVIGVIAHNAAGLFKRREEKE